MNVLLTGAGGQLGREVRESCPDDVALSALEREKLDITDSARVMRRVREVRPGLIINCAAYTAVDAAETGGQLAAAVNADGPAHLARAAREVQARLLHISTDYVFDGESDTPYGPDDPPRPLGVYGLTKAEGEGRVLETLPGALVLRTAGVYSCYGGNFVTTVLRLLRERESIDVVEDQIGAPTWARDLARVIWAFAARPDLAGIYHWTDDGSCSRFEFAGAIREEAMALGLSPDPARIIGQTTDRFINTLAKTFINTLAKGMKTDSPERIVAPRPRYSVLDCSATARDLGVQQVHWREQLQRMLRELKNTPPETSSAETFPAETSPGETSPAEKAL